MGVVGGEMAWDKSSVNNMMALSNDTLMSYHVKDSKPCQPDMSAVNISPSL